MSQDFIFLNPGVIKEDGLELVLVKTDIASKEKNYVPAYQFEMCNDKSGERIGDITLRVGFNENIKYGGNVGYGVDEKHRGHGYASRAVRLLFPFAKKNGMTELLVTCNPENSASRKTCERAGGKLMGIVDLPATNEQYLRGERQKCCYKFVI